MESKKIVVVMGGVSTEAEISRKTGHAVYNALKSKGYDVEELEFNPLNFASQM